MLKQILKEPDPLLRKYAEAIKDIQTKEIQDLIQDMKETMKKAEGVGLAATQIGVIRRLFVMEIEGKSYVLANPEIKKISEEKVLSEEGCLSVPDTWGLVKRAKKIIVKGIDENGKSVKIYGSGLLAKVIQHELDHLDGILFIDKAEKTFKIENNKVVEL